MRILVVDDNSLHLKMCRALLQNLGHDVETAESFSEVKEKAEEMDIDAALIDYRLTPGETGVDVLKYLKSLSNWKTAVFIAITADISEKTPLENSGFDKVVFKPVTEKLLKEIIG